MIPFVKNCVTLPPETLATQTSCRRYRWSYTTVSVGTRICVNSPSKEIPVEIDTTDSKEGQARCVTASWIMKTGEGRGVNSRPIFGTAWAPVKSKEQDDDLLYSGGFFVGGGGGARRSGITNRISFYSIEDAPVPYHLVHETDTYSDVCSSITVDTSGKLLAACFGKSICLYAIAQQGLVRLLEFVADQASKDPHVTSLVFGTRQNGKFLLATGGEDAVVRVWNLDISVENLEKACKVQPPVLEVEIRPRDIKQSEDEVNGEEKKAKKGEPKTPQLPSLDDKKLMSLTLGCELKEHTSCITCVRWHAPRKLVLSSGKDGFVCLWNSHDGSLLSKLATSSGLPPAANPASLKVQCRSCAISPSGSTIYTIQCGARGKAYAMLWNEQQLKSDQGKASSKNAIITEYIPSKFSVLSDSPITTADLRDDGECIAVGNVEGKISTWSIKNNKFQKLAEYAAHDLPVTSMTFIPVAYYLWRLLEALSTLLLVGAVLVLFLILINYFLLERDKW